MKPYLSIILEKVDEYVPMLSLTLIDLDHHLSKLKIPHEVLIVSKNEKNQEVANKFSRIAKNNVYKFFDKGIAVEDISGEVCLALRSNFVSEFESFKNLVESLNSKHNKDGYELVFGAVKDNASVSGLFNRLGKVLGSPIDLRFNHPIIGFTKNVAPSLLPLIKTNDIHLAMLADKLGFIVGEIPVRFRNGETQMISTNKKIGMLWELIKIKSFGASSILNTEERTAR